MTRASLAATLALLVAAMLLGGASTAQIVAGRPVGPQPAPAPAPVADLPQGDNSARVVSPDRLKTSGDESRDLTGVCAALASRDAPVEGKLFSAVVATPRPLKAEPFLDPNTRQCVTRVTDHRADGAKGFARNDYSRRQAFNADDSRFLVIAQDGYWHLYDARTSRHIKQLRGIGGDAEPQWNVKSPELLYFLPNNGVGMKLLELNTETDAVRTVADFSDRVRALWPGAQAVWTRSEGSPSANQRYWAFQVDNSKWQGLGLFVYDVQADRILASYDFAANGKSRPDHVSMSPTGDFVVVSWLDAVTAFRRDFSAPRVLQTKSEHSDLALTANGQDAYVAIDYARSGAPVFMFNLHTGERTDLFTTYIEGTATALHFSGKAFGRPGWVLMSTYGDYHNRGGDQPKWLHRKLYAVALKSDPQIFHVAAHQSASVGYFTEPQASVNRSFTRALFASNWGTRSETDIDTFMVQLAPDFLTRRR